jgi:hypothetical protein
LNESTVRRFMGLAGIGALSDTTVGKLQEQDELDPMADVSDDMPDDVSDDMPSMGDEEGMDDESADVDLTAEEAEVIIGLGAKLQAEMGGEEEGMDDMDDMAPAGDMPEGDMAPVPEEEAGPVMQEAFVQELSNRVARRVAQEHTINEEVNRRVADHLRKEHIINETMKRVAKRLTPRRRRR